jgi:EmrB/QacA subfamily drug resistance transporter
VPTAAHPTSPAAGGLALALLCVAQFIDVLGVTVVIVALPSIQRELGFAGQDLQWVVSVYALVFGGCLLLAGRAGDAFGPRRLFMLGLGLFGAASFACGLAPSPLSLVISRAAQALGAAMVVPAALALLTTIYPQGPGRDRALAVWTAAAAGGGAAGFVLGGLITASLGWEWVFLINTPIALISLALAPRALPATRSTDTRRSLDAWGAASVTAGLLAVIYGLTAAENAGLASPRTLAPLTLGIALIATFLLLESRVDAPLVPLGIFRRRMLVGANLTALALTGTTGAAAVLATSHLQQVLDRSPTATGFVFLPFSLCVVAGSAVAPALIARLGARRTAVSGLLGVGAAMLLFTRISPGGGIVYLVVGLSLAGASLGGASVAATGVGTAQARPGEQGLIAGLLNTATQLGTAIGIVVLTTIAAARTSAVSGDALNGATPALVEGFQTAYLAAAGLALAGASAAAALLAPSRATTNRRPGHQP